jgi:hypothetical protein
MQNPNTAEFSSDYIGKQRSRQRLYIAAASVKLLAAAAASRCNEHPESVHKPVTLQGSAALSCDQQSTQQWVSAASVEQLAAAAAAAAGRRLAWPKCMCITVQRSWLCSTAISKQAAVGQWQRVEQTATAIGTEPAQKDDVHC